MLQRFSIIFTPAVIAAFGAFQKYPVTVVSPFQGFLLLDAFTQGVASLALGYHMPRLQRGIENTDGKCYSRLYLRIRLPFI